MQVLVTEPVDKSPSPGAHGLEENTNMQYLSEFQKENREFKNNSIEEKENFKLSKIKINHDLFNIIFKNS